LLGIIQTYMDVIYENKSAHLWFKCTRLWCLNA